MKNLITILSKEGYKQTTNRSYYNKLRKRYLEHTGKINCSFCPCNKGENYKGKHYGGFEEDSVFSITYPNWKLISKNKKQWMKKDKLMISKEPCKRINKTYVKISF